MGGARQRRDLGREDARGRMGERGRGDAGMGAWSVASECPHSRGKGAASSVRPRRSPARPIQPLERGFQGSVRSPAKAGRGPRASLHPTASTCSRARLVSRRRDLRLPAQRRSQPCNTGARKTPGPPGLRGVLPPRHVGVGRVSPWDAPRSRWDARGVSRGDRGSLVARRQPPEGVSPGCSTRNRMAGPLRCSRVEVDRWDVLTGSPAPGRSPAMRRSS